VDRPVIEIRDPADYAAKLGNGIGVVYNDFVRSGRSRLQYNVLHATSCRWLARSNLQVRKWWAPDLVAAEAWLESNIGLKGEAWRRCRTCQSVAAEPTARTGLAPAALVKSQQGPPERQDTMAPTTPREAQRESTPPSPTTSTDVRAVRHAAEAPLKDLAGLVRRRNRIDQQIAQLIGRPSNPGNIGEFIAAEIFDIKLTGSGTTAGYDGTFRSGPYAGKTVNVKMYAQDGGLLDISQHAADFYIALTGPRPIVSGARSLPMRVDAVYLFDSAMLLDDLTERRVRVGTATSVRRHHWQRGQIYPPHEGAVWHLSEHQLELLRQFRWDVSPQAHLEPAEVTVVGVDGAPGGWAAVELFDRRVEDVRVFRTFRALVDEYGERARVIAVDMPIGLTDEGGREADRAARAFVGPRLRSTVFPSPPRWALEAPDYTAARALRPAGAKGVGSQTFALVRRIKEVAEVAESGAPVYEVHPEVSFCALKSAPLEWPKKTTEGREERLELLEAVGIVPPLKPVRGAAIEDVLDACVAAWSAHRIATRRAQVLPEADKMDWQPNAGVIWY
jgi:predicted RNase H-like nuclease